MPRHTVIINDTVRDILSRATTTGNALYLPPQQLDPKIYKMVNAALEAAGGKWKSGKTRAHLFQEDAGPILASMLDKGEVKDEAKALKAERQAFYTPEKIADNVASWADVEGHDVLEPSAGGGALATACIKHGATQVFCIEIHKPAVFALQHPCIEADFLKVTPQTGIHPEYNRRFSRIVMNPPFTRKSDAKHVFHAYKHWLAHRGILTAIIPDDGRDNPDITQSPNWKAEIVARYPAGTFRESGTNIATLLVRITEAWPS